MVPPRVTDDGGAGHEALYLMTQLIRRPDGNGGAYSEVGRCFFGGAIATVEYRELRSVEYFE